jgi:hypothetical protein
MKTIRQIAKRYHSFCGAVIAISLLLAGISGTARAQGSAGADAKIEPRYLIDVPTAGMLAHGGLALDMDFFENGGLLTSLSLGVFDRVLLGISYGGANLIGTDAAVWNKHPGFAIKVRLIEETEYIPAIALGFDSQGKEFYIDRLGRYAIKSMGLYGVLSKNYEAWGDLSLHGGVNYSFERDDGDDDPNLFVGIDKSIGPVADLLAEYNLGWNDSNRDALGRGRGYLDFGIRTSLGGGLTIGFNLKDVLKNQQDVSIGTRTVKIEYIKYL